jgi:hypothetical protein
VPAETAPMATFPCNRDAIRAEIKDWAFPRTFLDFEAIQFAILRWLGTRPFVQIPFHTRGLIA